METINNQTNFLKADLESTLRKDSKISIAAACFSIYAYKELKKELDSVKELRFIFTSPAFTTEKASKEKREFYIPRLSRERSLYGTEFEERIKKRLRTAEPIQDILPNRSFVFSTDFYPLHLLSCDSFDTP